MTKNGGIKGDVTYTAPDSANKFKQMSDITQVCHSFMSVLVSLIYIFNFQYLDYQKHIELTRDNFTFSSRVILGDYMQPVPPEMQTDGIDFMHLTEEEVSKR